MELPGQCMGQRLHLMNNNDPCRGRNSKKQAMCTLDCNLITSYLGCAIDEVVSPTCFVPSAPEFVMLVAIVNLTAMCCWNLSLSIFNVHPGRFAN
jgi:hypothetical protein